MVIFFFAVFGLLVGSSLNVCILRLHSGTSPFRGRSQCPHCKRPLRWFELIPVGSFLLQRGKCRQCGKSISWQYPLVELSTALAFAGLAVVFPPDVEPVVFASRALVTAFLVLLFAYDLRWQQLPDHFTIPAFVVAVIGSLLSGVNIFELLISVAAGAGVFWIQYVLSRGRWVGDGDIWMGAVMGASLAIPGVFMALFFAYVFGALAGLLLIVTHRATGKTRIPFGTFLSAATYAVFLLEKQITAFFGTL